MNTKMKLTAMIASIPFIMGCETMNTYDAAGIYFGDRAQVEAAKGNIRGARAAALLSVGSTLAGNREFQYQEGQRNRQALLEAARINANGGQSQNSNSDAKGEYVWMKSPSGKMYQMPREVAEEILENQRKELEQNKGQDRYIVLPPSRYIWTDRDEDWANAANETKDAATKRAIEEYNESLRHPNPYRR